MTSRDRFQKTSESIVLTSTWQVKIALEIVREKEREGMMRETSDKGNERGNGERAIEREKQERER